MKKNKCVIAAILFLQVCGFLHAQEETRVIAHSQSSIKGQQFSVVRTINDGDSNFSDVLMFGNKKVNLLSGEAYIDAKDGILITSSIGSDSKEGFKNLNSYKITSEKLVKTGAITISELNSCQVTNGSKAIIVSDEYEGYGQKISLYTSSLKHMSDYLPFGETGFSDSKMQISSSIVASVFFPTDKKMFAKLTSIDVETGKVNFEIELNSNYYKISQLEIIGDFILLKQHTTPDKQELLCFDKHGQMLWKKSNYVYAMQGVMENGELSLFAMDYLSYWFINPMTGVETEKISLLPYTFQKKVDDYSWIDLASNNKEELLLMVSRNLSTSEFEHTIYSLNKRISTPLKKDVIVNASETLNFVPLESSIILTDSKNQILKTYEN